MLKSMNFFRGKSRGRVIGGTKLALLAPVILGPVPRIFWQRVSNLVNKLVLLLHKCWFSVFSASTLSVILRRYSLPEVPWRRIHNAIAKAMSICVAAGNKVRDTRLPQPAGCGDKYDVSGLGFRRLFNSCCESFKYPSPDAKASPSPARGEGSGLLRRYTPRNDANPLGRSMIEMLGVLAIIGVLSVGGIAGYSKAMEKFKVNNAIEEYSYLIYGLLEHLDEIQKISQPTTDKYDITELIDALQLVPQTWIVQRSSVSGVNYNYLDPNQNWVSIFSRNNLLVFDIVIGGLTTDENQNFIAANFSANFCVELLNNIAYPLHSALNRLYMYKSKGGDKLFYGDNYCGGDKLCLKDITLQQMKDACSACSAGNEFCTLTLEF